MSKYFILGTRSRAALWLGTTLVCATACQTGVNPFETDSLADEIVGGTTAQPGAWPWQAQLQAPGYDHWCGGSLIHPHWIMTAGHCVDGLSASDITVVLGEHNRTFDEGAEQIRGVAAVIIHPDFNAALPVNDIALLRLSAPAAINDRVQPISLARGGDGSGLTSSVTGWGVTSAGGLAAVLRQADLPVLENAQCEAHFGFPLFATELCAGFEDGDHGGCSGDSGGPLVTQRINGEWEQIGIVSWGSLLCDSFTVFTRVSAFADWIDDYVPPFGATSVAQISAGGWHTCAVSGDGRVRCWGAGSHGTLGYGNTNDIGDDEHPSAAGDVDVGGKVVQLATSDLDHTCAVLENQNVRCWGNGVHNKLGYGAPYEDIGDDEVPASAGDVLVGGKVAQISLGVLSTCVLREDGQVMCWGRGYSGIVSIDLGGDVTRLALGGNHACALLSSGDVKCWGLGGRGQLGYSSTENVGHARVAEAAPVNVGGTVTQIALGAEHSCALLDTGDVRCWGHNNYGQLGYGNTNNIGDNESPATAGNVRLGAPALEITASSDHTCALLITGEVRCWGYNNSGQLGHGNKITIGDNEHPDSVPPVDIGGRAVDVSAGGVWWWNGGHTCALLNTGDVRCWGARYRGQLGYPNTSNIGDNETPATAGSVSIF